MSVITSREDFLKRITEVVGDDTSDASLQFIEDMTETYDELSSTDNEDWKQKYEEICDRADCVSLKMLAVTGSDLIQAGMNPGKELGETLNKMLEIVLDDPAMNTKEKLLKLLPL